MVSLDDLKAFAKSDYNNGRAFVESDFENDFKVFSTIKRQINAFLKHGRLEEKLMINNHIVVLNVFGKKKTNKILRCMMDDVQFSISKAILMFLRQYDFSLAQEVYPNRIMIDVLRHLGQRYNISGMGSV